MLEGEEEGTNRECVQGGSGDSGCHESGSYNGDCDNKHDECGGGGSIATEVVETVSTQEPGAILALLAKYPDWVHLNVERSAVQITNCVGAVIRHLPISPDLALAMTQ